MGLPRSIESLVRTSVLLLPLNPHAQSLRSSTVIYLNRNPIKVARYVQLVSPIYTVAIQLGFMHMVQEWDDSFAMYQKHSQMHGRVGSISSLPVGLMPLPYSTPKTLSLIRMIARSRSLATGLPKQLRCLRDHYGQLLPGHAILA